MNTPHAVVYVPVGNADVHVAVALVFARCQTKDTESRCLGLVPVADA
ncbi:MAG: hypothetical protein QM784_11590 [Polyangiaceae bacterium]